MLNHLEVMQEFAAIRRGNHPEWTGDRIANSEYYLRIVRQDFPGDAERIAVDIAQNVHDFSQETGLPPRTLHIAAEILNGAVT